MIQDMSRLNLTASLGVVTSEISISTGLVGYVLFTKGKSVRGIEAKKTGAAGLIVMVGSAK